MLMKLFCVFELFMQGTTDKSINVAIASASVQPFTEQQWRTNQQYIINTVSTVNTLCFHGLIVSVFLSLVLPDLRNSFN